MESNLSNVRVGSNSILGPQQSYGMTVSSPLTDSCAEANSIGDRQFFDRAGASLPGFELASALEIQQAPQKRAQTGRFLAKL
jgi:hypothetical protein